MNGWVYLVSPKNLSPTYIYTLSVDMSCPCQPSACDTHNEAVQRAIIRHIDRFGLLQRKMLFYCLEDIDELVFKEGNDGVRLNLSLLPLCINKKILLCCEKVHQMHNERLRCTYDESKHTGADLLDPC
jgi:hypothetical protein